MSDIALSLRKATKLYAGVPAIDGVDFDSAAGRSTHWSARTAPASQPSPR